MRKFLLPLVATSVTLASIGTEQIAGAQPRPAAKSPVAAKAPAVKPAPEPVATDASRLVGRPVIARNDSVSVKLGEEAIATGADFEYPVVARQANGAWLWVLTSKGYGWVKRADIFTPEEAIEASSKYLKTKPDDLDALWRRSRAYEALGQRDKETADLERMISIKPTALAYNARGAALVAIGKREQAIADFDKAIELESGYASAWFNRGMVHVKDAKFKEAVADFDGALQRNPRHIGSMVHRGVARENLGQHVEALADYTKAIEIDPNSSRAFNNRAWLLATCPVDSLLNPKQALADAKAAVKLTGGRNRDYADTLAAAMAANGDFPGAVEIQQRTIAATAKGDPLLPALEQRLALYKAKKPFREQRR